MSNWWSLGEWSGFPGEELGLNRITCPFCFESGNFEIAYHAEKKKPNSNKKLNFDTLKCGNCSGYVLTLWSNSKEFSSHDVHHDFKVLPWPLKYDKYPEHWPESIGRYWLQAKRNISGENWDAAALMARSALQIALRDQKAEGKTLYKEIDNLAEKGILPPIMQDWAHNVRELGNDSAHPKPDQKPTNPKDARDILQFLDFLLEYLYTLPKKINDYRERNKENNS